jgi:hypothetical protein
MSVTGSSKTLVPILQTTYTIDHVLIKYHNIRMCVCVCVCVWVWGGGGGK